VLSEVYSNGEPALGEATGDFWLHEQRCSDMVAIVATMSSRCSVRVDACLLFAGHQRCSDQRVVRGEGK